LKVLFHPEARDDLLQAAQWYEARRSGLGQALVAAVERAIATIREAPERWPAYPAGAPSRRFILRRFPLAVHYVIFDSALFIAAVAHLKRRPDYWSKRLPADHD